MFTRVFKYVSVLTKTGKLLFCFPICIYFSCPSLKMFHLPFLMFRIGLGISHVLILTFVQMHTVHVIMNYMALLFHCFNLIVQVYGCYLHKIDEIWES